MPDTAPSSTIAHEKYERLIKAALAQARVKVAVVHPCDDVSLEGAVEASRLGLIEPILRRTGSAHPRHCRTRWIGHQCHGNRAVRT